MQPRGIISPIPSLDLQRQACSSNTEENADCSHRRPHYFFDALEVLCEAGHADLAHNYLLWESKVSEPSTDKFASPLTGMEIDWIFKQLH